MAMLSPEELQYQIMNVNDDRRAAVIIGTAICGVTAYTFVILRLIAHKRAGTRLQPDDWAIIAALFFATAQYVDQPIGVGWGLGRHLILITDPVDFGKNLISAEIIYIWTIATVKISILLLWNRLFTSKAFRIAMWITGSLVMIMTVTGIVIVGLQCIPIEHLWNPYVPAVCLNMSLAATIFGAFNILTDIMIILLPIKQLMKLRLQRREKWQLYGLFLTGGLVTIISAARMVFTVRMTADDITWTYVDAGIWSSAETSAAIVSACLPTLRPLFGKKRAGTKISNYASYPSIGQSNRRSDMYQLGDGVPTSKLAAKTPAVVSVEPSWRDGA